MNINTRNMSFVNYNNQEMDWVKFNGNLVYENYKDKIVSGTNTISLNKAKASSLEYLKLYGNCEQSGVGIPSPSNIIPIVCNNGQLKVKHQSGLPIGYTKLDYITNASNTKINTNIEPDKDDIEIELRCRAVSGSWYMFQSRTGQSGTTFGITGSTSNSRISFSWGNSDCVSNITRTAGHILTIKAKAKNGSKTLYVKDETSNIEDTQTTTYTISNYPTTPFYLWGNSSQYIGANSNVYYLKFKVDGVTVLEYIPAKDDNNVVGFYDIANNVFVDEATVGSISGGNTELDPIKVYADSIIETIQDSLNNTATAQMLLKINDYKDVQEVLTGNITRNVGVLVLNGTEDWRDTPVAGIFRAHDVLNNYSSKTAQNIACICTHYVGNAPIVAGDDMPDKSIKCGLTNGTSSDYSYLYVKDSSFATVQEIQAYFAQQYALGTPAIIVFPQTTATTETTTPQNLNVQRGNNTISITQASLNQLELEAKYKGK